jgi:hypothetical protein
MKSLVDLCLDFHRKNRPTVLNDDYVMKSILMYKYSKNGTIDWVDHTLNTINEEILEILLNYPYRVVSINKNLLSEDVKNKLNDKKRYYHNFYYSFSIYPAIYAPSGYVNVG